MKITFDHLTDSTRYWCEAVCADYALEPHHERILLLAAEAFDRCAQARAVLDAKGLTTTDHHGNIRPRPEIVIERNCQTNFARLIRELDLDCAGPADSRPPALRSNRRLIHAG